MADDRFIKRCNQLRQFLVLHARIPRRITKEFRVTEHDRNENSLRIFVGGQRALMFKGRLSDERKVILDGINVGLLEYKLHYHSIRRDVSTRREHKNRTIKDIHSRIDGEPMDLDPNITVKGVHITPSVTTETLLFDISGNQIELGQKDTILSFTNPTYKTIMFDHFRTLGTITDMDENRNAANELFQMFNERGGRFFKLIPHTRAQYQEVDAKVAFESKCDLHHIRELTLIL